MEKSIQARFLGFAFGSARNDGEGMLRMTEQDLKSEKPKDRRFSQEQYDMLKRCSEKKDITEWNQWRNHNPAQDVLLEGADLKDCWLRGVLLNTKGSSHFSGEVHLEGAILTRANLIDANFEFSRMESAQLYAADLTRGKFWLAHLEGAFLNGTCLEEAQLNSSYLKGAIFYRARVKGATFSAAIVDSSTSFWGLKVNRHHGNCKGTNFTGVGLRTVRIDPGTKQLLEYNIRRMNWEDWYNYKNWQAKKDERHILIKKLMWFIRKFWEISDYGISTNEIIKTFFKWAFVFAIVYYAWGLIDYQLIGNKNYPGIVSNLFVIEDSNQAVSGWLVPLRSIYFSIVTMTTLGLGDMYANTNSLFRGIFGHILLALQVILGYVLLGALVTRFAVLFTAGGPAGKFADEKEKEDKK